MEEKFYFCEICGNLMLAAISSGVDPYCCGDEMTLLMPNTVDAKKEKHVPVVTYTSNHSMKVCIGEEPHPMVPSHHIRFVCLVTTKGCVIRYMKDGDEPEVCIHFDGTPLSVYAYCNIHGLWRADVPKQETKCNKKECPSM